MVILDILAFLQRCLEKVLGRGQEECALTYVSSHRIPRRTLEQAISAFGPGTPRQDYDPCETLVINSSTKKYQVANTYYVGNLVLIFEVRAGKKL
jgi:hypothetical protein